MKTFLSSNETRYRLLRTILQGIIGVIISNLDLIVGTFSIPVEYKPLITALVMAILSPIMSTLGGLEPVAELPGEADSMGRGTDYELQEDEEIDTE